MDVNRAKEILHSKDMFPVHLDGNSVWIESVDEANRMATVQVGTNPGNTQTVSVDRLQEAQ
ncbi:MULTISPECIES: H-type small acid-soluble spore protein [unclassified Paenibacillus]|uniref:H-type small acid-soluble spore protein n=1 Tax=unclassified Paenibacillus TaxID=185978 RepID=UPI001C1021DA|nr:MULTISPECIES: H-type small acid-soluble spore protein [unclassified Paenibacillus]MBU5443450.1 H-type small acid-soluble spore protein [Paenibacillus sp. MSJ-34]CAH0119401.1 Small, acid-soluble spore protein H [Paenibacillus sp. CECT 9249]